MPRLTAGAGDVALGHVLEETVVDVRYAVVPEFLGIGHIDDGAVGGFEVEL